MEEESVIRDLEPMDLDNGDNGERYALQTEAARAIHTCVASLLVPEERTPVLFAYLVAGEARMIVHKQVQPVHETAAFYWAGVGVMLGADSEESAWLKSFGAACASSSTGHETFAPVPPISERQQHHLDQLESCMKQQMALPGVAQSSLWLLIYYDDSGSSSNKYVCKSGGFAWRNYMHLALIKTAFMCMSDSVFNREQAVEMAKMLSRGEDNWASRAFEEYFFAAPLPVALVAPVAHKKRRQAPKKKRATKKGARIQQDDVDALFGIDNDDDDDNGDDDDEDDN